MESALSALLLIAKEVNEDAGSTYLEDLLPWPLLKGVMPGVVDTNRGDQVLLGRWTEARLKLTLDLRVVANSM